MKPSEYSTWTKLASCGILSTNLTFMLMTCATHAAISQMSLPPISDREENLFIDYFREKTVPEILEIKTGLGWYFNYQY